ncbi:hypothetical protein, partial [Escherichia coli]|uniref:hypothetical protein n=2 Tax=Escherichia coli TaxID=562 RepID=UPI003AEBB811
MGSCAAPSAKGDDKFITTDYLQQCLPSNLPDRRDRKSPPQGEILIVSARWHGDRFFHHEPDFLGVKDQRFGTPIAQPLSERRLSGAERSVDPDYHCRRPLT